ncbi:hypothetical protein CERZMDRAFT_115911 [Cercospora zeae-maydis SCOH1-5]|uniref:Homing endonuclease LAGLIDADG domain-containing protein n=1 Tax=Cercospora zeae-maydis SCOH1-5 TaxID=717836 RepID=A0A6A6EXC2_9PEZI|nr:hypothetical protein CERZMDRAFT_115911 [Cercospora zeae-maydis SCOH1-5]
MRFTYKASNSYISKKISRLKGKYRIGPHDHEVLSIIFGSLLGDAHGEKRQSGTGTRITFYQESSHIEYMLFIHKLLSGLGYCNTRVPVIGTRLGSGAIWIMDDGGKVGKALKFSSHFFAYEDCLKLVNALNVNFSIKSSIQSAGTENQHIIYVHKESMNKLREIVNPYMVKNMRYKID